VPSISSIAWQVWYSYLWTAGLISISIHFGGLITQPPSLGSWKSSILGSIVERIRAIASNTCDKVSCVLRTQASSRQALASKGSWVGVFKGNVGILWSLRAGRKIQGLLTLTVFWLQVWCTIAILRTDGDRFVDVTLGLQQTACVASAWNVNVRKAFCILALSFGRLPQPWCVRIKEIQRECCGISRLLVFSYYGLLGHAGCIFGLGLWKSRWSGIKPRGCPYSIRARFVVHFLVSIRSPCRMQCRCSP